MGSAGGRSGVAGSAVADLSDGMALATSVGLAGKGEGCCGRPGGVPGGMVGEAALSLGSDRIWTVWCGVVRGSFWVVVA